jgi:hypothetical protein
MLEREKLRKLLLEKETHPFRPKVEEDLTKKLPQPTQK